MTENASGIRLALPNAQNEIPGESVEYRDIATLADGTPVLGRLVLVEKSDPDLFVDLTGRVGGEIQLNANSRGTGSSGDTATFRLEYYNQNTGDPVSLNTFMTFQDLDRARNGTENVSVGKQFLSGYTTSDSSDLAINDSGNVVSASGGTSTTGADQDAWFTANVADQPFVEFTLTARGGQTNYGITNALPDDAVFEAFGAQKYHIVAKDENPNSPFYDPVDMRFEWNADDDVLVKDGDTLCFTGDVDENVKIKSETGAPVSINMEFPEDSTAGGYDVEIKDNVAADIAIPDTVNLGDVAIKAKDSDGITLTAGDDVSIEKVEGSDTSDNSITFGDNGSVAEDVKTGDGNDTLIMGEGSFIGKGVDLGDGDNALTLGSGTTVEGDVKAGDGNDVMTFGDDVTIDDKKIETKDGDDVITAGDNFSVKEIKTDKGSDTLTTGSDTYIEKLDMGEDADIANIGPFDRSEIAAKGKDIELKGGGGSKTTDLDCLNLDISWLTPSELARFEFELADAGYADTNGDGVFTIQEGDPSEDPDADKKVEFELDDGTKIKLEDWEKIGPVCFARGTRIVTSRGEVAIEDLRAGDTVLTMDSGYQDIRWVGSTRVPGKRHLAPIRIMRGTFGNARDVVVSPQHRILLKGSQIQMLMGESEALVAAKHLVDGSNVVVEEVDEVEYFHMLFADHEIVYAEGMPSESFHPAAVGLDSLGEDTRREIYELFPELEADVAAYGASCRVSLKKHEASLAARGAGI